MKKLFFCLAAIVAAGTTATAQQNSRIIIKDDGAVEYSKHSQVVSLIPERTIVLGSGGVVKYPDGTSVTCPNSGGICAITESATQGPITAGERVFITPTEDGSDPFSAIVLEIRYDNGKLYGKNLLLREDGEGVKQLKK